MEAKRGRAFARWTGLGAALCLASGVAQATTDAEERVRDDIERFVRGLVSEEASVSVDVPQLTAFFVDRDRYPGALRTELSTRAQEPLRGRVPIAVALYAGDHLVKRSVVTPYVRVGERVVVPTRDLKSGSVLSSGDVRLVERDAARLPKDAVRELDFAIGMRAKGSLRKDRAFRGSQIQAVPLIERGDRVQLFLSSGPLVIQSAGKAQEAGAFGEWIRVLNVDSKRELSGRVDAEGRVHVSF